MTEVKATLKNELVRGTVINGYRIERELGRGAMAIVYLATQLDLGRPVAFKVLSSELSADADFVTRFFNEARSAAALSHPNIIQAIDAGQTADGLYYFCMEYVDGETLLDMLKREGRIPVAKALEWFGQIADALNYGWEMHKFTHGDIKPENIMINRQGQAKLADFGLARVDGHDYSGKVIMLTPLYAPPELIRGERFSEECRPDIYAFGASLYHALAGTPPYPGTDAQIVIQRHLTEELEPLSHRNMLIPKELSDFVSMMLVKDMAGRLGSWKEVMDGLKRMAALVAANKRPMAFTRPEGERGGAPRGAAGASARAKAPAPQKKSGSGLFIVVLILLLGVLVGVAWAVISRKNAPKAPEPLVNELGAEESVKPQKPVKTSPPPVVPAPTVVEQPSRDAIPTVAVETQEGEKKADNAPEEELDSADDEMEDSQKQGKKTAQKRGEDEKADDEADVTEDAKEKPTAEDGAAERQDHLLAYALNDEQAEFRAHAALALLWLEISGQFNGVVNVRALDERVNALAAEPWFTESQRNNVQFMRETLFADCARLPAYLKERLADIRQLTIPVDREGWCIQDFGAADKMTATVKVSKQGMSNHVPKDWGTLHRKGVLAELCCKLVENGNKKTSEDSVPLSYLAVSGFTKEYERLIKQYPDDDVLQSWRLPLEWERFRANQKGERTALTLWGQMASYADAGSVEGTFAKGRELTEKCENTKVFKVFLPAITPLMEKCNGLCAATMSRKLLETAQGELADKDNDSPEMLTPLMIWNARHGNDVRSSVESKNERLLGGAFRRLAEKRNYFMGPVSSVPFLITESAYHKPGFSPARVMAYQSKLKDDQKVDKIRKRLDDALVTLMRLEIGDWNFARKNYKSLQWKELENASVEELRDGGAALGAAAMFGRAMLLTRFDGDVDRADKLMTSVLKQPKTLPSSVAAYSLALEYWLLTRRGTVAASELPLPFAGKATLRNVMQADRQLNSGTVKRRFVYLFLAALFETGLQDEAVSLLKSIDKDKDNINGQLSIVDNFVPLFKELLSFHRDGEEINGLERKLSEFHDANYVMEYFKAKFSACGERALDGSADERFKNVFSRWAPSSRPIGGDVVFDWTLRRVAWELANGSLETANELVSWTLDLNATCLIPYYGRLLALQAGLRLLAGKRGAVLDAPFLAERATVLSEREQKIFKCLADYPKISEYKLKGTLRQMEYLWYQWMVSCGQFGEIGTDSAEFKALQKRRNELTLSERVLLSGLQTHISIRN